MSRACPICGATLHRKVLKTCSGECRAKYIAKHGLYKTPEYRSWMNMKSRCYNPKNKRFDLYGARGISVCEKWKDSFVAFLSDVGKKPAPGAHLDRIDVNGNYEPTNVRWLDHTTSAQNKRATPILTIDGRAGSSHEWARETGTPARTIYKRLVAGWSYAEAVYGRVVSFGVKQ